MQKHTLPPLLYKYDALEPWIDAKTMEIHHTKHHQAYVDKLNIALEKYPDLQNKSLEELLTSLDSIPEDIRTAVRNNAGGHWNHSFFWEIMTPTQPPPYQGGGERRGSPVKEIEKFKKEFSEKALGIFGSGWAWLVQDKDKNLKVITTSNQDSPIMQDLKPILGIDIWEHAYYLKYQNRRAEYIDAWWNIVNWQEVKKKF